MNAQTLGVLLIIFSACGFATLAIFIKFAYAAGANTVTVLAYRFTIAALLFGAVIRLCGLDFRVTGKQAVQLCLLGVSATALCQRYLLSRYFTYRPALPE